MEILDLIISLIHRITLTLNAEVLTDDQVP